MSDVKHFFGIALRIERLEQGFSQEELAHRAGLHRTYISDVERGARNPSLQSIEKLAGALGLSVSRLFSRLGSDSGEIPLVEILLVEDDPADVVLAKKIFEKARIINPVHVVQDGVEALEFLLAKGSYGNRAKRPMPGVILLDLKLPKMNGLELLRRLKRNARTSSIPVVVITASRRDQDILSVGNLGVDNYIVKPLDLENFMKATPLFHLEWRLTKPPDA